MFPTVDVWIVLIAILCVELSSSVTCPSKVAISFLYFKSVGLRFLAEGGVRVVLSPNGRGDGS